MHGDVDESARSSSSNLSRFQIADLHCCLHTVYKCASLLAPGSDRWSISQSSATLSQSVSHHLFHWYVQKLPSSTTPLSFEAPAKRNPREYPQGHPRSIIVVPIESAYTTSYLSPIVTMVLSCTVSEIRPLIG